MRTLMLVEGWAVTQLSLDDGHTGTVGYFSSYDKAHAFQAKRCDSRAHCAIVPRDLWIDDIGNHYIVEMKSVDVDLPSRQEALAKLTLSDRKALGL